MHAIGHRSIPEQFVEYPMLEASWCAPPMAPGAMRQRGPDAPRSSPVLLLGEGAGEGTGCGDIFVSAGVARHFPSACQVPCWKFLQDDSTAAHVLAMLLKVEGDHSRESP